MAKNEEKKPEEQTDAPAADAPEETANSGKPASKTKPSVWVFDSNGKSVYAGSDKDKAKAVGEAHGGTVTTDPKRAEAMQKAYSQNHPVV